MSRCERLRQDDAPEGARPRHADGRCGLPLVARHGENAAAINLAHIGGVVKRKTDDRGEQSALRFMPMLGST